jgi:hypothetical protein
MQIIKYDDGSQSEIFEPGDRVKLNSRYPETWIAKSGESATVIRFAHKNDPPLIRFLEVQTDGMREGKWGVITVPPWFLEPLENA